MRTYRAEQVLHISGWACGSEIEFRMVVTFKVHPGSKQTDIDPADPYAMIREQRARADNAESALAAKDADIARLREGAERTNRNRDMWKGQVGRQSAQIAAKDARIAEMEADNARLKNPGGGWETPEDRAKVLKLARELWNEDQYSCSWSGENREHYIIRAAMQIATKGGASNG